MRKQEIIVQDDVALSHSPLLCSTQMADMLVAAQSNSWHSCQYYFAARMHGRCKLVLAISRFTVPRLKMSLGQKFEFFLVIT